MRSNGDFVVIIEPYPSASHSWAFNNVNTENGKAIQYII